MNDVLTILNGYHQSMNGEFKINGPAINTNTCNKLLSAFLVLLISHHLHTDDGHCEVVETLYILYSNIAQNAIWERVTK